MGRTPTGIRWDAEITSPFLKARDASLIPRQVLFLWPPTISLFGVPAHTLRSRSITYLFPLLVDSSKELTVEYLCRYTRQDAPTSNRYKQQVYPDHSVERKERVKRSCEDLP